MHLPHCRLPQKLLLLGHYLPGQGPAPVPPGPRGAAGQGVQPTPPGAGSAAPQAGRPRRVSRGVADRPGQGQRPSSGVQAWGWWAWVGASSSAPCQEKTRHGCHISRCLLRDPSPAPVLIRADDKTEVAGQLPGCLGSKGDIGSGGGGERTAAPQAALRRHYKGHWN